MVTCVWSHMLLSMWICMCLSVYVCVWELACMHNAVMVWMRDIGLPSLIMRKAVYWSESQNRHTHADANLEGNQSPAHLQTCFDPQATDGYLSSSLQTHLPSMFPLSFSLCKYLWSRFISFPPASSLSPSPSLCIFDHFGWKSKSGMSLGLDFISEWFIKHHISKRFGFIDMYVQYVYVCTQHVFIITEAERYMFRFLMHKTETLLKAALSIQQSVLF